MIDLTPELARTYIIVDVWAEYYRLSKEEGWTQKKIAEVKQVGKNIVSSRVKFYQLPDKIKEYSRQGLLTEAHLDEITSIPVNGNFEIWLTPEQITSELAEKIKHDTGKNGSKTVKATREDAKKWKEFIAYAAEVYEDLPEETQLFVGADNGNAQFESFDARA